MDRRSDAGSEIEPPGEFTRARVTGRGQLNRLHNRCPPDPGELTTMAQRITHLLQGHQRWDALADNAAYSHYSSQGSLEHV